MIIEKSLSVDPEIGCIKTLIARVTLDQDKMTAFFSVLHPRDRSDLAKRVFMGACRRTKKTDRLFFKAENRFFDLFNADRKSTRGFVTEFGHPIQARLVMRMFQKNRTRAIFPENFHAMAFFRKDFGVKIPFIAEVKKFLGPLLEMNGPEDQMIQKRTKTDPDKRKSPENHLGGMIFKGKVFGVFLEGDFQRAAARNR